jgi:hypothetical protein
LGGTDGSGPGGDISVTAGTSLDVHDDGSITSESRATGLAGSIAVNAGESMLLRNNGRITTAARLADGGDIAIAVGSFASMSNALIETQVGSGNGNGGNVDFRVPTLVMDGSTISANAYGGNGGNIHLGTTTFVPSGDSAVTASSKLGIDGTITLDSPALDPTSQLLVPPPAFVDVAAILAGRCGPRLAGRASSLVVLPVPLPAAGPDEWRVCAPVAMAK